MPYNTELWILIDNYWICNAGFGELIDNYWICNAEFWKLIDNNLLYYERFWKLINEYLLFISDNILLKSRFSISKAIDDDYRRRATSIKSHKIYRNPLASALELCDPA